MIGNKVEQSDLVGDIEGFPIEVVQRMVDEQMAQGNQCNIYVFQKERKSGRLEGGFAWGISYGKISFWVNVIINKDFDVFFNKYPKQQIKMEEKTIKISVPEGYEVDEANSTFTEIKFKPIVSKYPKCWEDAFINKKLDGFYVESQAIVSRVYVGAATELDKNVFKTEKQANAMLAYVQITQLMALPCYNGDWVPDWTDGSKKHVIGRSGNIITRNFYAVIYEKLAFISGEAMDAFYSNHMDLLKTYFELD